MGRWGRTPPVCQYLCDMLAALDALSECLYHDFLGSIGGEGQYGCP